MRILLVTPPVTAPTGPSPEVAGLAGCLHTTTHAVTVADANLALVLRLLSRDGVADLLRAADESPDPLARHIARHAAWYLDTIDVAVRGVQGRDAGAVALCGRRGYLPPSCDPRPADAAIRARHLHALAQELGGLTESQRRAASAMDPGRMAYGVSADDDRAVGLARRVVEDILELVRRVVDPAFTIVDGADRPGRRPQPVDALAARLQGPPTCVDAHVDAIGDALTAAHRPEVAVLFVADGADPYFALRIARRVKQARPSTRIVLRLDAAAAARALAGVPGALAPVDAVTHSDDARALAREITGADAAALSGEGSVPAYTAFPLGDYLPIGGPAGRAVPFWQQLTMDGDGEDDAAVTRWLTRVAVMTAATGQTGVRLAGASPARLQYLVRRLLDDGPPMAWWADAPLEALPAGDAAVFARAGCVGITAEWTWPDGAPLSDDARTRLTAVARWCAAFAREGVAVTLRLPDEGLTGSAAIEAAEFIRQLVLAGVVQTATPCREAGVDAPPATLEPAFVDEAIGAPASPPAAR